MMVVFAVFFGLLARLPSEGIPYPLFAFGGLVPWQFFARVFGEASSSLIAEQRLITRVYFPRVIIPLAATLVASVELLISGCLLIVIMLFYGVMPGPALVTLPIFLILLYVIVLGAGLLFAALNVEYRDVMYLVPFFVQVLFFLTPIVYPSRMVPEMFRIVYGLNPMVGVVEGFRWAFFGIGQGFTPMLISSAVIGILLLVVGIFWFARMERTFADTIGS
jgi:lipopolysaccharide transport system permease protein